MALRVWNMNWCCSKINLANSKIIIISVYSNSTHNCVNISWKSNNWNNTDENRKCSLYVNSASLYQVLFACTFNLINSTVVHVYFRIYDTLKKTTDSIQGIKLNVVNLVRFCNICFEVHFYGLQSLFWFLAS